MRLINADELKKKLQARRNNSEEDLDKGYDLGIGTAMNLIDSAPTVDIIGEKIIRCPDCKYYHPFKHWCDCHEDWAGGEDGFCSLAERKEE